ncbi:periplasmic nitrate reductase, NapE protein [Paraburkholderia adhaesiva]|uniref:periplasmic nitrate reductase, NapE protein n=1 Tax=Paraburkholderia adhaesiva TaxID=2883244 RepID=UPI001F183F92|nr:periplasmic nitrate reductase, NapE protein [Paraburkholderia adhaesiva]
MSDVPAKDVRPTDVPTRSQELLSFLFLTVVLIPVLTVLFIAAYGFAVWIYQMLIGGPPHH